ncbi:MAG: hypothetical protein AB1489_12190 [Acidobacteriota bacterium]
MGKTKRAQRENSKADPVAVKLALSHQLEQELDQTGLDYVILLIDKSANPDIAVATNRVHTELPRLLRQIANRLEMGGVDLP